MIGQRHFATTLPAALLGLLAAADTAVTAVDARSIFALLRGSNARDLKTFGSEDTRVPDRTPDDLPAAEPEAGTLAFDDPEADSDEDAYDDSIAPMPGVDADAPLALEDDDLAPSEAVFADPGDDMYMEPTEADVFAMPPTPGAYGDDGLVEDPARDVDDALTPEEVRADTTLGGVPEVPAEDDDAYDEDDVSGEDDTSIFGTDTIDADMPTEGPDSDDIDFAAEPAVAPIEA